MPKSPEFYKKRRSHGKEMREILPIDKQLEHPIERPGKVGVPPQELVEMRSSQGIEDQFFIQTLFLKLKERLNQEISQEQIEELNKLEELSKKEKERFIRALQVYFFYQEGMKDDRDIDVRMATAETLGALVKHNLDLYIDLYKEGMDGEDFSVRRAIAGTLGVLAKQLGKDELLTDIQDILKDKYKLKNHTFLFALMRVQDLVENNKDLSELILLDLPAYQSIGALEPF